ncbi:MAG: hypothetical protein A2X36_04630 [Elusimicrobia bacterium GWA2_69_24]|nr:MAG: hypothetical protein A2X36_04630 [Elusimicrobia bacterium GWA2_69_24]HBL17545.1 hypothetical protein [Elusimicrobiota bacterium]
MPIKSLRRFGLLRTLPLSELRRIARISRMDSFPAGTLIFRKSETAHNMFVVLAGRVKIFSRSGSKKRKTFAYLGPGDFFGEMAVIDNKQRSASAEAVEATRLLIIRKADFRRLLLSDARLCFSMLRAFSARLRQADDEIESLLYRNILGRVAKALHDLANAERIGTGRLVLRQRYTHQELADLVGTTREPLSRALSILRESGLVESRDGRIVIREPQKLETLIHNSLRTD